MAHKHKPPTVSTMVAIIIVFSLLLLAIVWFAKQSAKRKNIRAAEKLRGFAAVSNLGNGVLFGNNGIFGPNTPGSPRATTAVATPVYATATTVPNNQDLHLQAYSPTSYNNKYNNDSSDSSSGNNNTTNKQGVPQFVIRFYAQQECAHSEAFKATWKICKTRMKNGNQGKNLHFHKITCDGDKENEQLKCSFAQIVRADGSVARLKATPTVTIALHGDKKEQLLFDEPISHERLERAIREYIDQKTIAYHYGRNY